MSFILNKIGIEDYEHHSSLFSKLIRGKLSFYPDVHILDKGKKISVALYRDHPRVLEFIEKAMSKGYVKMTKQYYKSNSSAYKIIINDTDFMVQGGGECTIEIIEYNFNSKEITFADFDKGKTGIVINMTFENETDNTKLRSEIKSLEKGE